MRFISKLFSVLSIVFFIALSLLVCFEVYFGIAKAISPKSYPTVLGFSKAVVLTDSMEPTISAGDLLIYKSQDDYSVDDIVIFYDESVNAYVTHRIVREGNGKFYTKGDANNTEDDSHISGDDIEGMVVAQIPDFNKFLDFIRSKNGIFIITVFLAAALFLPPLLRRILK